MPIFVGVRWIVASNESEVTENCHFLLLVVAVSFEILYDTKIIMSEYVVPQWFFIDIETDYLE